MACMDDNLQIIKDFLDRHLDNPPERIQPENRLEEIGIDSLGMLELIFSMEEKYGIRLSGDLPTPRTVGDLLQIFEKFRQAAK